jgi:hypothetical protein
MAKRNRKQIELVFPKPTIEEAEEEDEFIRKSPAGDILYKFVASIDEVAGWFKQYQVDSIELSISGAVETGGALKLIVSAKGEAGLKVTLKPKPHT